MQLFGQHDLKNLVQFLTLFREQLEQSDSDMNKLDLFERVKAQMPVIMSRVERINPKSVTLAAYTEEIDTEDILNSLAQAHGLKLDIKGRAQYTGSINHIREALNNVLENFRQHHGTATTVHVDIESHLQDVSITIFTDKPPDLELIPATRMFEPFYTTSRSGMGLGLYLARLALHEVDGTIKLLQEDNCYGFLITLHLKNQG